MLLRVSAVVMALLVGLFAYARPDRLLRIASGATSQILCSQTFVGGRDPGEVFAQESRPEPGMGLISWALSYDVDKSQSRVDTTIFGLFQTRAKYQPGYGCVLDYGQAPFAPPESKDAPAASRTFPNPEPVAPISIPLKAAIDAAFAEHKNAPPRWTKAIVIVHRGEIVGERYAPGISVTTRMNSHSIAKTVTNALIGILVRQGKLTIDAKAPIAEWTNANDPRRAITIDQLLRMSAGLPLDQGVGPGLSETMWFTKADQAAFAARASLAAAPGVQWSYSNLSYTLLSKIVADQTGRTPRDVAGFAQRELFGPANMPSAILEFDATGTPLGGNSFFATARDWARLGLLYLNDGVIDGQRILPEGWVAYSTRPTLDSGYGAGVWLNTLSTPIPGWGASWGLPGAPSDAFMARGYLGQYVIVVPSQDLVIVRLGVSHDSYGDIFGVADLTRQVIQALRD